MVNQFAAVHYLGHRVEIAAVVLIELGLGRHVDQFAAEQTVTADDFVADCQQPFGQMTAQEPGDPSNENAQSGAMLRLNG